MPTVDNEPSETALVRNFFDLVNSDKFDEATDLLSEDVFYHNIPLPEMVGRDNVRDFHKGFGVGSRVTIDWQLTRIAQSGNAVLTERIDIFRHRNGAEIVLPIMGSMVVESGAITQWRDYFDLGDFERQAASFRP
ncbi:limonene-1,2-epoxide hydrolase [Mycolicibacterium sp. 018/SC-01/001]|uniref:limonene-1,2-epoxide hydrolase family protein n=1 Tax=Mycolicibacterium sp. 018/SC-01/001 TaxID=2592069 RepID=UPI00117C2401|nr:limonene-1,2-epoxide hydrolase family protein [Mycolicibacterium sp. 018/SC-01/001]TRW78590.1 limonene-1,2-epoxide hydrolase [Mycolicibacterium sp. 018/SC-01/001]